jgi:hypothetical protein
MMEAANTSEMLVNFYQTTQCNNPEDSHLHTHCCENLKSHISPTLFSKYMFYIAYIIVFVTVIIIAPAADVVKSGVPQGSLQDPYF